MPDSLKNLREIVSWRLSTDKTQPPQTFCSIKSITQSSETNCMTGLGSLACEDACACVCLYMLCVCVCVSILQMYPEITPVFKGSLEA